MTTDKIRNQYLFSVHLIAIIGIVFSVGFTIDKQILLADISKKNYIESHLAREIASIEKLRERVEQQEAVILYYRLVEYIRRYNSMKAKKIAKEIIKASQAHGIPPEVYAGVIRVESAFNPQAVSRTNARGLAQIVSSTARMHGMPWEKWDDIETSVQYGAEHLRWQLDRSDGDMWTALGRYNGWDDPRYQAKVMSIGDLLTD